MEFPRISILGKDPKHRMHRLNGVSYQEDALTTFNGWQYAVFYATTTASVESQEADAPLHLYLHLARRPLRDPEHAWQTLVFEDYPQTTDDGHNTAQLGICHGDGTIHLSYDHHCDILRYRHSLAGLALEPDRYEWSAGRFTGTLDALPGLSSTLKQFHDVSYPRFRSVGDDLLFTHRLGRAGLGSDVLYKYSATSGSYTAIGQHLTGIKNNPYINGLDYRDGRLHLTWTYRGFVWYEGWDDPLDTKHKAQAGPNGAENNYDICYAYSDDLGMTWKTGGKEGNTVADLSKGESVNPDTGGIVAFSIPKNSGLTNQESQAVDHDGGVHVLNRDNTGGELQWKHYYRSPSGKWSSSVIPGFKEASIRKRGSVAIAKNNNLYLALPDSATQSLKILRATSSSSYEIFDQGFDLEGCDGEPAVDKVWLEEDNELGILTTRAVGSDRDVVVVHLKEW